MRLKRIIYLIAAQLVAFGFCNGQSNILKDYVTRAFENNLTVQQHSYGYEASVKAIASAKAEYLPKVQLLSRYSVASGGRTFDIPSGSLLNPVFGSLNAINSSVGSLDPDFINQGVFDEIGDEEVKFLRSKEQQVNFRVEWPILNDDIRHNYKQQKLISRSREIELSSFKKLLAKEVQVAYYQHLKTLEGLKALRLSLSEIRESKRLVEALYKIGRLSILDKEEIEIEEMEVSQEILEARSDSLSTQIFFNYLLNEPADALIRKGAESRYQEVQFNIEELISASHVNAGQLQLDDVNVMMTAEALKNEKNGFKPKLFLIGDAGIQGETYTFQDDAKFAQASLSLRWDLVDFSRKYNKDKLKIESEIQKLNKDDSEKKLESEVLMKYREVLDSKSAWDLAKSKSIALRKVYQQKLRLYQNGQISFFEWSQSRNRLNAATNFEVTEHYDYLIKCAELQWICGTYE